MAEIQSELALAEGDKIIRISNDSWLHGVALNPSYETTWGTKISYNEQAKKFMFTKKYLYLSFIVDCEPLDFSSPRNAKISINDILIYENQEVGDSNGYVYGSRSKEIKITDTRTLMHFNIPTSFLYGISKIKKIDVSITYDDARLGGSSNKVLEKTLNLEENITVYEYYKWVGYKSTIGLPYWELSNSGGSVYSPKEISPSNTLSSGSSSIYSKTSNLQNPTNSKYFTREDGEVVVALNEVKFLSGDGYRQPSKYYFYGESLTGSEEEEKELRPNNVSNNGIHNNKILEIVFNSEDFANFSKITKVTAYFGENDNEIVLIDNCELINCDKPENVPLSFTLTQTDNNGYINIFKKITQEKEVVLEAIFKGYTETQDYPFIYSSTGFLEEKESKIKSPELSLDLTNNGKIQIDYEREYSCKVKGQSLNLNDCPFETGEQKFICNVTNNLRTRSQEKTYTYTFETNGINLQQLQESVVLDGPSIAIQHDNNETGTTYEVEGTIINPGEYLNFSGTSFKKYSLTNGEETEMTVSDYSIKYGNQKPSNYDPQNFDYTDLRDLYKAETNIETNYTVDLELYYDFNNEKIHSFPFLFTLGRIVTPFVSSYKTSEKGIQYYLRDNGGDKNEQSSANNFIDNRKEGIYTSLSRKPKNGKTAQERVYMYFKGTDGEEEIEIIPTSNNLNLLLDLLKEGQFNDFKFSYLGSSYVDEQGEPIGKFKEFLQKQDNLTITFHLQYLYENDTSSYYKDLIVIEIEEVDFYQQKIPLALRKNGVIINPKKENDDLDDSNNRKNHFLINTKDIPRKGGNGDDKNNFVPTNGFKIIFQTDGRNLSGDKDMDCPTFEIFLDSNGEICFSNGTKTFKPFN